ncbi:unnamed protein product [Closterium sp. NIES-54]
MIRWKGYDPTEDSWVVEADMGNARRALKDYLVLQRFDFTYSSPQATPLSTRHSLLALPSDESVEPSGPYPELVGCLMYLMTCTRPDLAYPLSILARFVAPGRHRPEHMAAAKRVLRYLCGYAAVVIGLHLQPWLRLCFELRWLTYLLTDLGDPPRSPPVLYVDNKAMLALCREHRLEHRTKHIALRYFLARELQQRGQLHLAYVASEANTTDIFTKALPPGDHQRFCTMLDCVVFLLHENFPYHWRHFILDSTMNGKKLLLHFRSLNYEYCNGHHITRYHDDYVTDRQANIAKWNLMVKRIHEVNGTSDSKPCTVCLAFFSFHGTDFPLSSSPRSGFPESHRLAESDSVESGYCSYLPWWISGGLDLCPRCLRQDKWQQPRAHSSACRLRSSYYQFDRGRCSHAQQQGCNQCRNPQEGVPQMICQGEGEVAQDWEGKLEASIQKYHKVVVVNGSWVWPRPRLGGADLVVGCTAECSRPAAVGELVDEDGRPAR